jgi:hypothetical protein
MVALISFLLNVVASLFKSKSRLEAENAALRHQLIVLQRKVRGRVLSFPKIWSGLDSRREVESSHHASRWLRSSAGNFGQWPYVGKVIGVGDCYGFGCREGRHRSIEIPARTYDEVAATKTMIERTEETLGLKPDRLAADTAYGTCRFLHWVIGTGITPHIPVWDMSKREENKFRKPLK